MTKTQSVSATKLAVATAVLLAAGGLAMATMPAMQSNKSAGSTSGANLVKVSSCEQKGADIEVSRNNSPKYMMKAGCKNTGNGFLNYTYQCVSGGVASSTPGSTTSTSSGTASSTQGTATSAAYKVFWAPCSNITILPDADTLTATGGVVTVGANKLLAVFDFAAYAKEATITSLILTKTGTVKNENLTNIKLTDANGSLLSNSHFSPLSPDKLLFTFNKVVPTNAIVATKLMISADILNATPGEGDTLSLGINSISDVGTTSFIGVSLPVTYGPVKVIGAVAPLSVSWTSDTPFGGAVAPSMGQVVGKLKFSNSGGATQETAKITSLIIDGASTFPVSGWKLFKDSTSSSPLAEGQAVASETGTFKVAFSNFETMIAGGQDKTFFITADTAGVVPGSNKSLSITIKSVGDIGSSVAVKDIFPLSWKTFSY